MRLLYGCEVVVRQIAYRHALCGNSKCNPASISTYFNALTYTHAHNALPDGTLRVQLITFACYSQSQRPNGQLDGRIVVCSQTARRWSAIK